MGKKRLRAERRAAGIRSRYLHVLGQTNGLLDVFERDGNGRVDKAVALQARLAELTTGPISCKKGCYGCCYQAVAANLSEGLSIARQLFLDHRATPEMVEQLTAAADGIEASKKDVWFREAHACVFLDKDTKDCTIYDVRPGACRSYAVNTDPVLCYPDRDEPVGVLNTMPSSVISVRAADQFDEAMHKTTGFRGAFLSIGCLPRMVLYGIGIVLNGMKIFKPEDFTKLESVEDIRKSVPHLAPDEGELNDVDRKGMKQYVEAIIAAIDDPAFSTALIDGAIAEARAHTGADAPAGDDEQLRNAPGEAGPP